MLTFARVNSKHVHLLSVLMIVASFLDERMIMKVEAARSTRGGVTLRRRRVQGWILPRLLPRLLP